jgi:endonuclease/exonuclease/phosphatase (EEP) superfamily protein YafD
MTNSQNHVDLAFHPERTPVPLLFEIILLLLCVAMGNASAVPDENSSTYNLIGQEIPSHNNVLSELGKLNCDFAENVPTTLPQTFRVLVWNIYKGRMEAFYRDFSGLYDACELVLLQEMALTDELTANAYKKRPDMHWEHAANFLQRDGTRTGVGTGSPAKPLTVAFRVSEDLEPWVKLPKTIIVTQYAIADSALTLLVLNIHGINFQGTQGLENQVNDV